MAGQANNEIRATLAISQQEAFMGTTRTLTLPGGQQVMVTIPAGSQPGQEIHLTNPSEIRLILTLALALDGTPQTSNSYPPYMTPAPVPYSIPSTNSNNPNIIRRSQFAAPGMPTPYPPPILSNMQQTNPLYSQPGHTPYLPSSRPGNIPNLSYQSSGTAHPLYSQPSNNPLYSPSSQPGNTSYPTELPPSTQTDQSETNQSIRAKLPVKSKRARSVYNLLIVLTLFLIIASALFYIFGNYVPAQEKMHATATTQGEAINAALSQASATKGAISIATSQAHTTATAQAPYIDAYNKITATNPTLNDSLSAPNLNNWDTNKTCTFQNGSYHILETQNGFFRDCFAEAPTFNNFAFQVQMNILKGDAGGLVFRANPTNGKLYLFVIGADGSYSLFYYPDETGKTASRLEDGTTTSLTQGYNYNNLIMVIAHGSTIDLYINKNYVSSIQDNALNSGKIGVIANYKTTTTEVTYNQAQVWKI